MVRVCAAAMKQYVQVGDRVAGTTSQIVGFNPGLHFAYTRDRIYRQRRLCFGGNAGCHFPGVHMVWDKVNIPN